MEKFTPEELLKWLYWANQAKIFQYPDTGQEPEYEAIKRQLTRTPEMTETEISILAQAIHRSYSRSKEDGIKVLSGALRQLGVVIAKD